MLRIRPPQLEALGLAAVREFEQRLLADVRTTLPEHFEAVGEEDALELIRECFPRAAACGLETQAALALFVHFTFLFGEEFEREHDWAREVLDPAATDHEAERCKRLAAAAERYLRELDAGIREE